MESQISHLFTEHDIVPVLIDRAPLVFAKISYRSKKLVDAGKELAPAEVHDEPKVEWDADPVIFYTLVMIDPDSPSRTEPLNREFIHWLVGNIPGKHLDQGEVLFEYLPVVPRAGTGFHRYIFLLYQQHCHNDYSDAPRASRRTRSPRLHFSTRDFTHRYSLGQPIAGNFFVARFDEYVPAILAQFPQSNDY